MLVVGDLCINENGTVYALSEGTILILANEKNTHAKQHIVMNKQLEHLKSLIQKGVEYPEALFRVGERFNLSSKQVEKLGDLYDWEQSQ